MKANRWDIASSESQETTDALVEAILADDLGEVEIFRDNWRTRSVCFRHGGRRIMLKVPRARNHRLWERLLTLFRGSDVFRLYRHLQLLKSIGLGAPEAVLAGELRKCGVVTDAFLCYRYVEGRRAGPEDAEAVLRALRTLHQQGYLRTDAQLANFLVGPDGSVVFIDFRLKRPWFLPQLGKARELDRFLRSCPDARQYLSEDERGSAWLKVAHCLESISFGRRNLKRRLRGRKKAKP